MKTTTHQRPKLYPPRALLAGRPVLGLAFTGPDRAAAQAPAPTLSDMELRRIVAASIG